MYSDRNSWGVNYPYSIAIDMEESKYPINIVSLADTLIRGERAITFPLINHNGWISDQKGHHILDVRGWGFFQYADNGKGAEMQDDLGDWVVASLNWMYEEELIKLAYKKVNPTK